MKKLLLIALVTAFAAALTLSGCTYGFRSDGEYVTAPSNQHEDATLLNDTTYSGPKYRYVVVDSRSYVEMMTRLNAYGAQGWVFAGTIDHATAVMYKPVTP
jgi:ABC-type oligopeptide transport system substrate-binding subunit